MRLGDVVSGPVLGLDPGLAALGWAVVERVGPGVVLRAHGVLATGPADGTPLTRVGLLSDGVVALLEEHGPALVVTEAWVDGYAGKGADTTAAYALGMVLGMIRVVCRRADVVHCEGERAQGWRIALGLPRTASKADAQERVRAVLGLGKVIRPQHASDAAAVAIVAAMRGGRM